MTIASCSFCSLLRPGDARIQVTSAPAQNDGPSPDRTTPRSLSGGSSESRLNVDAQLADQLGVERVVDVRPGERDARDDAAGPVRSTRRLSLTARLTRCVVVQGRVAQVAQARLASGCAPKSVRLGLGANQIAVRFDGRADARRDQSALNAAAARRGRTSAPRNQPAPALM